MDWATASAGATDARLRASLAGIDRLLAGLERVESDEAIAVEGVSGSWAGELPAGACYFAAGSVVPARRPTSMPAVRPKISTLTSSSL
ncbi:hypothetical protein D3C86_2104370 [compost metagenome]